MRRSVLPSPGGCRLVPRANCVKMAFSHAARLLLALFTVVTAGRSAAGSRVLSGRVWTRGLCHLTVSENLPQGSVLPLPMVLAPEETLDLTHNNAYFGLLTTPDNNTTTTTTTTTSGTGRGELEIVWRSLIEEGVVTTTRLRPSLVSLSSLNREFVCQREPECDCRYGNSLPDRRFASGQIDGVERLICRLGVDVIIRPIDKTPVPTKARLSAVSLIRFPRPERLYVCLAPALWPVHAGRFRVGSPADLWRPGNQTTRARHAGVRGESGGAFGAPDNTLHAYTIRCSDAAGNRGDAKADLEGLGGGLFSVSFGLDTPQPGLQRSTEAWLNLVVVADMDLEAEAAKLATAGEAAGRRVVGWPMVCVVEATDGLHTGQLGVRIRPKDVNDHRPAWQPPLLLTSKVHLEPSVNGSQTADDTVEWTVRLAESVSPYLPLLQLRARDPDRDFGQLTFRARHGPGSSPAAMFGHLDAACRALLGSANERAASLSASPLASSAASELASPFSLFRIDPAGGEVSLTGRLDYETVRQSEEEAVITFYSASRVGLSNGLKGPRQPVFGPGVTARTRLLLRENQRPSRPLDYLTMTDADGPSNGKPTCHLIDNPLPGVFNLTQLGPELWALVGLALVDQEQFSGKTSPSSAGVYHGLQTSRVAIAAPTLLQLIVRCQDNPEPWQPRLETRAVIVLEVLDENDNAPVFLSGRRLGDTGQLLKVT
ncbi:unnamed protein product [Protopolystoma xenopodis]|uniref:Cadherin domain-containing protein n=1 Tax=Protopolystoma xenopodis TaxID=117903 RepID=A0A3S5CGE9_9PLAT|nr:unnamed protein product [Protopolystoma xenopodis]